MNPLQRSPLHGSVFALVLTAVALLTSLLLRPYLEPDASVLFVAAVWLSAWYHGRMGGFVATGASAASIIYFFARSDLASTMPARNALIRFAAFLVLTVLITWITSSWRDSRRLLASTLSSIGDAVLVTDREGRITFMNALAETLTGWPHNEARNKPVTEVMKLVDEQSEQPVENALTRAPRERVTVSLHEQPVLISRSGSRTPIEQSAAPVREDSGPVRGGIAVFRDISKRRQLEEQVTQSQKMDAVGRLAGGIAGDFNNVLTVITGYAELLRHEIPSTSPLRRFVDEIIYAGERAAGLIRHLLAFSKGPGTQPSVLDVNAIAGRMEPMLRRMLGTEIELTLLPAPGLGHIQADPEQIEQVILNLVANSRDAMPGGGKLVIETENVDLDGVGARNLALKPGSYVMLALSDTGVGMAPETRTRLFEPFFTTKGPGKGSGLGLATVYGIVKQSDGQITVYSQPGCGTIFEIYWPRATEATEVRAGLKKAPPKGSETILVVDDEEGVRKLVCAVLKSHGYDVLEAANGGAALATHEKNGHKIDMVLTDIVMPQMNGFELGRELESRTPGLRVLYMSGYREHAAAGAPNGLPRAFLHKPFTPDTLLAKVREVLDTQPNL